MHLKKSDLWVYIFLGILVNEFPAKEASLLWKSLVAWE